MSRKTNVIILLFLVLVPVMLGYAIYFSEDFGIPKPIVYSLSGLLFGWVILAFSASSADFSDIFLVTCPACNKRAMSKTSETVIVGTEYSPGQSRVREKCTNCSHKSVYTINQ